MAFLLTLLALVLLAFFLRRSWRAAVMAALAAIFVFAAIFALDPDLYRRQLVSTVETVKELPKTHYGVIWASALRISAEYPLFGIGPRAYRTVCLDPDFGPLYPYTSHEMRCATHPHNFYLEWLVDSGLVGLSLFVLALALITKRLLAGLRPRPLDYAYAALLATFFARLWPVASSTSFHHAWLAVPLWLIIGWALSYHEVGKTAEAAQPSPLAWLARLRSTRR
jgi:O-antigen ligase